MAKSLADMVAEYKAAKKVVDTAEHTPEAFNRVLEARRVMRRLYNEASQDGVYLAFAEGVSR